MDKKKEPELLDDADLDKASGGITLDNGIKRSGNVVMSGGSTMNKLPKSDGGKAGNGQ